MKYDSKKIIYLDFKLKKIGNVESSLESVSNDNLGEIKDDLKNFNGYFFSTKKEYVVMPLNWGNAY